MRAMGKVLAVLLLCGCGCFYYGGQACASPLKNYEPGHVAVSAGGNIPTNILSFLKMHGTCGHTRFLMSMAMRKAITSICSDWS